MIVVIITNKIWKIKGKSERVSDETLIEMIKAGELTGDDYIKSNDMRDFVKIADTVYGFYLGRDL